MSEAEHEGKGPVLPESVRALLEAVPAGIAVVGSDDGHVHFWNQAALRQLGIRGLEGPPHTLPSAGNRPAPGGALEVQTARGALRAQVYALPSPCQDLLAVLLLPASDEPPAEAYRALAETATDAIVMIDESGRIGYVNDALAGVLGYSAAPLTGEPLLRLIPERLRGAHQAGLSRYLQTGRRGIPWQGVELAALHRDGHEVPVEVSFSEFAHGGRRYFVGFLRDITERRAAEAVLEQSRQAVVRAQEEKQLFYAEVIRAVTGERLSLVDPARLPVEGQPALEVDLTYPAGCTELRRGLEGIARASGMPEDAAADLIAAAGEAASNAVKHAHDGVAAVFTTSDRIVVRVSDRGPGIRAENLPATILLPGFSTAVSLGMGYTMMLNLADHVWLSTGPQGTIVQMDRRIRPGDAEDGFLRAALERLGRE